MSVVHSQFDGRSDDITIEELFPEGAPETDASGILTRGSSFATTIKEALADHYDRQVSEFSNYEVVVEPDGDITVRPPAVFG